MINVCCYVAPGFELVNNVLTFPTPSTGIAPVSVNLTPRDRRKLIEHLKESDHVVLDMVQVWMIEKGSLSTSIKKSLVWEVGNGETWQTQVLVEDPLASVLLKTLAWT